ncbi:enoyl-CoA hydratase/isomerase family protein [Pedobacter flavus]|uniref:Enoyl-CoA hydratase-related protein n=1 Tax=Pedobacter flavus TaxID=3113906 RepID=A0ABU7H1S5_9SPHI|nr:enoyl-CoA hydratase-related protein [Pedobacter sp. VNH31]MEE1884506.1 enoyl-CoA hydratase-related protein [Pedobacter sp. VNH31]
MNYQNLFVNIEDQILFITINREAKLNALNKSTLEEIAQVLNSNVDNKEVLGVLITGAGSKAFVAGADISEFSNYSIEEGKKLAAIGQDSVFNLIENYPKPVIAAVNGFALGGGLELAMSAHMRVASDNARLGLPEVTLGLIPGYGGTQRLPRLIGKGKAIEMIVTADMIDAKQAESLGLVNYVVAQDELINKCKEIFSKIVQRSPTAIKAAIKAVNAYSSADGFDVEIQSFGECFGTEDFKEGVDAFLNKRKPNFKGN